MSNNRIWLWQMIVLFSLCALFFVEDVSASPLQEIPDRLASALDTTSYVAGMILGGAIVVSVGLALAAAKMEFPGIAIILLAVIGVVTVIGWFEIWYIIMAAIIVAIMFASKIKEVIAG